MLGLIIGLLCCASMAGTLAGYLAITKKKYYDGHDQSSLSNTFYHTGWKFRVLLVVLCLFLIYPILLANGIHTSGGWMYYAPYTLLSWGKVAFAVAMGGLISVALNAYGNYEHENRAHVASASIIAAGGAIIGCVLRKEWYVAVVIWLAWLGYYLWKNHKNNKAGNPNAWGLYIELVAFYALPTSLAAFMLINYLM